jgi:NAD+ synthase (glutamine-hydrolysing)
MLNHGLLRLAAISPEVRVADPPANARQIIAAVEESGPCHLAVLPELCLTGYTAADLFGQQRLLDAAVHALQRLVEWSAAGGPAIVVGMPLAVRGRLYNTAVVVSGGGIAGAVPKQALPTYAEFYEQRWFCPADGSEPPQCELLGQAVPFGIDLLFTCGPCVLGVEICEDLWIPSPPSSFLALAGANVLVNLSASTETIGKAPWRESLVRVQAGRCLAAYAYASAGPTESTTDVVYGAHCLIAEAGTLLSESRRVGDGGPHWSGATRAVADVDLERLEHDRRTTGTFAIGQRWLPRRYRSIAFQLPQAPLPGVPLRPISGAPFVPQVDRDLHVRCAEVFDIQSHALLKRIRRLPAESPLQIGVSGGLDSTLALLVAARTCDAGGWPRSRIVGTTMPGFGTTNQTLTQARELMARLDVTAREIDIRELSLRAFMALEHRPLGVDLIGLDVEQLQHALVERGDQSGGDLILENVQARIRTFLLMNSGFVLGTGDMSEQALGWSTYNGDHMSMYNVNAGVPKTLVKFLVRYAADYQFVGELRGLLHRIADTMISPELLPPSASGQIQQATEDALGPYELHDFFLYHVVRFGFGPRKVLLLAEHARFSTDYLPAELRRHLTTFYRRFFANQFKRSCVPDGPKVGSVSLSPRSDWRMPSDAEVTVWLAELAEVGDRT